MRTTLLAGAALVLLVAGAPAPGSPEAKVTNPLLAPWTGPYGGVPPFDKVEVAQVGPALDAAMAEELAEVDRIANATAPATFENTLSALERSGRTLDRVGTIFGVWAGTLSSPEFQKVERETAPKMAAFRDRIVQNEALFRRIAAVYEARETASLTPEQKRLSWLRYTNFVRAGARLDPEAKKRLSEINQRLATLYTSFGQYVLADETDYVLVLESEADLAGLPAPLRCRRRGGRGAARPQGQVGDHSTRARAWSRS